MKKLWLAVGLSTAVIFAAEADARKGEGADGIISYTAPTPKPTPNQLFAVSSHPPSDRALLSEIQNRLITLGYDPGPADGLMGWQTRRAIRIFQERANLRVDGEPSGLLLDRLRAAVALSSKPRHRQRQVKKSPATDLERLVQQLTHAIRQAERRRRAEPAFLAELAGILRPYRRPKHREVLRENFSDGNFTTNPTWTVASGNFRVSRQDGLVSRVKSGRRGDRHNDTSEEIVADVLTQILTGQQQQRRPESRPEAAVISTRAGFGNDFELKGSLLVRGNSVCDVGVFDSTGQGYVLSLRGGRNPVLIRRAGGRTEIIGRSNSGQAASPETVYNFRWTRDPGGDMQVQLAEGAEIRTNDNVLGGNFDGVVHSNRSGKCVLRAISVVGTF